MSTLQPQQILCPVDFSEHSAAALRLAGGVARAFGAEVTVLHAQKLEAPVYFTVAQTKALKEQLRRSTRAARTYVKKFAARHLSQEVARTVLIVEGDPVRAILRSVKNRKVELIVMGTHGRTGLERIRLGSVAESVLRQTDVPVMTIGPGSKSVRSAGAIRRILCPVNYTESDAVAIHHAAALAEKTGAELIVTHVAEHETDPARARNMRQELCDWVPSGVRSRCSVKETVRQGHPAEQLVAEGKESGADLIVVSARPRSLLGTVLFGSTTEFVIRNAASPVLSVIQK